MARSHPPTLLSLVARALADEHLISRGETALVAVSGGPDSMALLHVLAALRRKLGYAVVAHGVDHGLRPEAAEELDAAARFAQSLEVPFDRTRVSLGPGGNLQARARALRYDALRAAARRAGCAVIATAHHLEDRAETVLLRLLRGAGPRGLAVLPFRAGDLVRPLLRAPRAAIEAHLARHEVPFALDPSNRDPRYLRVRVRRELLPLLRELSPGIDGHLCALADQLDDVLDRDSARAPAALDAAGAASRGAQEAIAALVARESAIARVPLKGGFVARWDGASRSLRVEPAGAPCGRSREATATRGPGATHAGGAMSADAAGASPTPSLPRGARGEPEQHGQREEAEQPEQGGQGAIPPRKHK